MTFDTVSWKFISKTLDYINFGESIKNGYIFFRKEQKQLFYKLGSCLTSFIKNGAADKAIHCHHIYISFMCKCSWKNVTKNINIKGIVINNKEMKICQYAHNTQILLDGTEQSLKENLQILSKFLNLSGLKINEEKPGAIWIGAKSNSNNKLCKDQCCQINLQTLV